MKIEEIVDKALGFKALQEREELLWLLKKISDLAVRDLGVELGVCRGGTLFALSHFFNTIIGVDVGRVELPFELKPQDKYLIGKTQDEKILNSVPDNIDFLLIDADHSYGGVKRDYYNWKSKVRKGGIIAFHDIVGAVGCDGVNKFWSEIKETGLKIDEIKVNPKLFGIGIILV